MDLFIMLLAVAGFLEIILLVFLSILARKSDSSPRYNDEHERKERRVKSDLNKIKKQIEA